MVVLLLLLGLAVVLLDVLGDQKAGGGELLDVRNVVVLGNVDAEHCAHYKREAASDYPHCSP